jgi:hypothetical protein
VVHATNVPLRGNSNSLISPPLQRGHRCCTGKVVAAQSPHRLPISWGLSPGQVEMSGASAFCIERSFGSFTGGNALTKRYNSIP